MSTKTTFPGATEGDRKLTVAGVPLTARVEVLAEDAARLNAASPFTKGDTVVVFAYVGYPNQWLGLVALGCIDGKSWMVGGVAGNGWQEESAPTLEDAVRRLAEDPANTGRPYAKTRRPTRRAGRRVTVKATDTLVLPDGREVPVSEITAPAPLTAT